MRNIDIRDFCSVDETRMAICTPFAFNGWKYATDGRIAVRVPTDEPDDSNKPYKRPDASALFKDFNVTGLEAFEIPSLQGVEKIRCYSCDGSGEQTCDMGHDHECPECDGDGHYEKWPTKEVGGIQFSERFLSKMAALPGLKFYPTVATWTKDVPAHPAYFTFDNGQGLVMPMRIHLRQRPRAGHADENSPSTTAKGWSCR